MAKTAKTVSVTVPTPTDEHPFRRVRRAGVPIVAYETGDAWASIATCMKALNGKADSTPAYQWDCLRGLNPLNEAARKIQSARGPAPTDSVFLPGCLSALASPRPDGDADKPDRDDPLTIPQAAVVFFHNAQRFLDDPQVVQGICNLRNPAKGIGATLILLGPCFTLPVEIRDDTITIEEPSPRGEVIRRVVSSGVQDAQAAARESGIEFPAPDPESVIDTLTGYRSEFQVDQALALSFTSSGVDVNRLWDLRVAALRGTAGLEIIKPSVTFNHLAGCEGAKRIMRHILAGKRRVKGVLQLDELNRMISGGGGGDLSGTTDAMIEQWLYWTTEHRVRALLLLGVPGAGKSATCKCLAGEAGVPLLRASMSTVKGSLVGQSENQMRKLLGAVSSITDDEVVMVATCNDFGALSPEIIARFREATLVYDFPNQEENAALWTLYRSKLAIPDGEPNPASKNWVGREIESCCEKAADWNCTLAEAAESVVPIAVSDRAKMDALRNSMSGRFLSASHPGAYEFRAAEATFAPESTTRHKVTF